MGSQEGQTSWDRQESAWEFCSGAATAQGLLWAVSPRQEQGGHWEFISLQRRAGRKKNNFTPIPQKIHRKMPHFPLLSSNYQTQLLPLKSALSQTIPTIFQLFFWDNNKFNSHFRVYKFQAASFPSLVVFSFSRFFFPFSSFFFLFQLFLPFSSCFFPFSSCFSLLQLFGMDPEFPARSGFNPSKPSAGTTGIFQNIHENSGITAEPARGKIFTL